MPAVTANPPTNFRDSYLAPDRPANRSKDLRGEIPAPDAVDKTQARQQPRQETVRRRVAVERDAPERTADLAKSRAPARGDAGAHGGETGGGVTAVTGNPRATIAKAIAVRASAIGSAAPSSAALGVAAAASAAESTARAELSRQQGEDIAAAYASKEETRGQNFSVRV